MHYKTTDTSETQDNLPTSNRLIVLAGVSACGKTTLLGSIMKEKAAELCRTIGLQKPKSALYLNRTLRYLKSLNIKHADEIVIDFDFLHHSTHKISGEFPLLQTLIKQSHQTTVITLSVDTQSLYKRYKKRLDLEAIHGEQTMGQPLDKEQVLAMKQYKQNVLEFYNNGSELPGLYQSWESFVNSSNVDRHLLIDSSSKHMTLSSYTPAKVAAILTAKGSHHV